MMFNGECIPANIALSFEEGHHPLEWIAINPMIMDRKPYSRQPSRNRPPPWTALARVGARLWSGFGLIKGRAPRSPR